MVAYCLSNCKKYKAHKPPVGISRYAVGQKRCQHCEIYIYCEGPKCPCCDRPLRQKPRNRKNKEKCLLQKKKENSSTNVLRCDNFR